jgi:hypothetical protein
MPIYIQITKKKPKLYFKVELENYPTKYLPSRQLFRKKIVEESERHILQPVHFSASCRFFWVIKKKES